MKKLIIEGKCWCSYKKTITVCDEEAEDFMKECGENMDTAYCQIMEEDITGIDCVDDGTVKCEPTLLRSNAI